MKKGDSKIDEGENSKKEKKKKLKMSDFMKMAKANLDMIKEIKEISGLNLIVLEKSHGLQQGIIAKQNAKMEMLINRMDRQEWFMKKIAQRLFSESFEKFGDFGNYPHGIAGTSHAKEASSSRVKISEIEEEEEENVKTVEKGKKPRSGVYTVGDFMTRKEDLRVVKPTTTVDEALQTLVEHRITGFPVIDDDWKLVGLVSDYDLLALDSISGGGRTENSMFPEVDSTWKTFNKVQKLLSKTNGKVVVDLMTPAPVVVHETTNLEDAASAAIGTLGTQFPLANGKDCRVS
ncbi:hypothetical protein GH714_014837 [Hevea brasiliensis]|uniref:CBS domain-containing protein n=1 Tax=Hevea brasiliensis TaxID=3981 RepID=A0A6A6K4U9_HEVBR|nr:hypothetical protein GH714_014837 [Hevea brasiliensis]